MMPLPEQQLLADRSVRNAAKSVFQSRLAQIKGDLATRSVGGRIADKATGEARALASEGLAIARESKGVIAATGGAIALWIFRKPILDAALPLLERMNVPLPQTFADWLARTDKDDAS